MGINMPTTTGGVSFKYPNDFVLDVALGSGYNNRGMWAIWSNIMISYVAELGRKELLRNDSLVLRWEGTYCNNSRALQERFDACVAQSRGENELYMEKIS